MDNLPRKQTSGVGLSFDYDSVPEFADELRAIADRIHPLSINLTKNIVEMGFHLEAPQGRDDLELSFLDSEYRADGRDRVSLLHRHDSPF